MFVILRVTFILGFVLKHFIRKPYDKYLPFIACGYEGGMIGYSLYTGLVGVENLSVIAVIDIAALLFTFSIMSNVLVLIEDTCFSCGNIGNTCKCQWADEWFHVKSGRCDLDYHERHDNGSDVTNDFTGSRL